MIIIITSIICATAIVISGMICDGDRNTWEIINAKRQEEKTKRKMLDLEIEKEYTKQTEINRFG